MTRGEIDVLRDIASHGSVARSYYDTFPGRRTIAKNLMWRGFVELGGVLMEDVVLTPAGRHAVSNY